MKKSLGPFKGYYLFVQISSILLCSVFGSLTAGIWLDRRLGTTPWLVFVLMIGGFVLGIYIIYRTVKGLK